MNSDQFPQGSWCRSLCICIMECNVGCLAARGKHFILYKLYQIKFRISNPQFLLCPLIPRINSWFDFSIFTAKKPFLSFQSFNSVSKYLMRTERNFLSFNCCVAPANFCSLLSIRPLTVLHFPNDICSLCSQFPRLPRLRNGVTRGDPRGLGRRPVARLWLCHDKMCAEDCQKPL